MRKRFSTKRSDSVENVKRVIIVEVNRDGGSDMKKIYSREAVERILKSKVEIPVSVEEKIQKTYRNLGVICESFPKNENNSTSYHPVSPF